MDTYYVNRTPDVDGNHEVHKDGCHRMPSLLNRELLGDFYGCYSAVAKAKEIYPTADGCRICSPNCHTG